MKKTILNLVFLATATVHAAPKAQYLEIYQSLEEESKKANERLAAFTELMKENQRYERALERSEEENAQNIEKITSLNSEVAQVNASLKLTEEKLKAAEGTCAATQKELEATKADLNRTHTDLENVRHALKEAEKLQQDQQKQIESNNLKIKEMSEERKTLEKKLQAQEGFFQNTLHQFARALGLPNTRSATEAQAIQEAIYRLKRSEKELSEINKDMKATIKTQKQTIQIMEEKNRMLEENQKEQIDSINKKEKAIQDLNTQCTKLASDLQDVSEKAATAEAKNMRLSTELEASSERVKTLENALKNEQDASEEFKQKTQDVIAKLSKEYEKTLQEVVEKTKKTTEEALSDLFSRNKNSGSSSDQSPKTVRKSSMFGILGLFC